MSAALRGLAGVLDATAALPPHPSVVLDGILLALGDTLKTADGSALRLARLAADVGRLIELAGVCVCVCVCVVGFLVWLWLWLSLYSMRAPACMYVCACVRKYFQSLSCAHTCVA